MDEILAEIRPALFGFCIVGIPLIYFAVKTNKYMIMLFSPTFLISGFAFQILNTNSMISNILIDKLGTLFATTGGIFLGNSFLRYQANQKEKEKIAILLVNSLKSHQAILKKIDLSISTHDSLNKETENIKFHQLELKNDQAFKISFKRIGIYSKTEIELISDYYTQLQKYSSQLEILLIESNKNSLINTISFNEIKITQFFLQIIGLLCIFNFSYKFIKNNKREYRKYFAFNYIKIIQNTLDKNHTYDMLFILGKNTAMQMIDELKYIREKYKKIDISSNKSWEEIYICQVHLNIENHELFSKFHMNIPVKYGIFLSIAKSEIKSVEKCKDLIKNKLEKEHSPEQINLLIEASQFKSDIVSPWS